MFADPTHAMRFCVLRHFVLAGSLAVMGLVSVLHTLLWIAPAYAGGSPAGEPFLVRDINTGTNGSFPYRLTNVSGTLFFVDFDGVSGSELWKSDGTPTGTVLVRDIVTGTGSSFLFGDDLTAVNDTLFFQANDGVSGIELWKSDGTPIGTVRVGDIFAGANDSIPNSRPTSTAGCSSRPTTACTAVSYGASSPSAGSTCRSCSATTNVTHDC